MIDETGHFTPFCNGRPSGAQADSSARRAGGPARSRGCRTLLDGLAAEGDCRSHPRNHPPIAHNPSTIALPAAPAGFASLIAAEFRGKRFALLWRGSRNRFRTRDFHGRCDGRAPTLTLIQDTEGNIFGGFTPVEWESRQWNGKSGREDNRGKADPSLESFLFTLKNPQNLPARTFALKAERKDRAIYCLSSSGPCFYDIGVSGNCNANTDSCSFSSLGGSYTNDTRLDAETVLTGSMFFTVKEIEVFEITD
jgi:hypothetical protein